MSYNPITSSEIQVKQPLKQELFQKIKDNFDYLYNKSLVNVNILNGSFENDSDNDGVPDNWQVFTFPSGIGQYETTDVFHGYKAYKFTHPGGVGNGGGYLLSDYISIVPSISPVVSLYMKSSVANIKNEVHVLYYDNNYIYISTETLYSSTSNPTGWSHFTFICIPPSNAKYMKIKLIGGESSVNVAGTTLFDYVDVDILPKKIMFELSMPERSNTGSTYLDVLPPVTLKIPKGFNYLIFSAQFSVLDPNYVAGIRFRIGSVYSPAYEAQYEHIGNIHFKISSLSSTQSMYMQLRNSTGSVPSCVASYIRL